MIFRARQSRNIAVSRYWYGGCSSYYLTTLITEVGVCSGHGGPAQHFTADNRVGKAPLTPTPLTFPTPRYLLQFSITNNSNISAPCTPATSIQTDQGKILKLPHPCVLNECGGGRPEGRGGLGPRRTHRAPQEFCGVLKRDLKR